MNWINAAENTLIAFEMENQVPFRLERFDCELSQLPDVFIVYFLISDTPLTHYDNQETSHEIKIQVSLFYRDISAIKTLPDNIIDAFTATGFKRIGNSRIPYQINTQHYGWRCDFNYYEKR